MNNWIGEPVSAEAATPTAAAEPEEAFDHEVAEHLRSLDDDGSFLLDLLQMFRNDSHALLQNLQDAIAAGDTKNIRGYSHQLKGSTGLLGLKALSAACARVEHDHESVAAAMRHMPTVLEEYERALAYVNDLAARTAA